jgi:hypothetical protein
MSFSILSSLINGADTPAVYANSSSASAVPGSAHSVSSAAQNSLQNAALFISTGVLIACGVNLGARIIIRSVNHGVNYVRRHWGHAARPAPIVPVAPVKPAPSKEVLEARAAQFNRELEKSYEARSGDEAELDPRKIPLPSDSVPIEKDLTKADVSGVLAEFRQIAKDRLPTMIESYVQTKDPAVLGKVWGKLNEAQRMAIHQAIAHQGDAAFSQHLTVLFANVVISPKIRAELLNLAAISNLMDSAQQILREDSVCKPTYQMSQVDRQVALSLATTNQMKKLIDPAKDCSIQ